MAPSICIWYRWPKLSRVFSNPTVEEMARKAVSDNNRVPRYEIRMRLWRCRMAISSVFYALPGFSKFFTTAAHLCEMLCAITMGHAVVLFLVLSVQPGAAQAPSGAAGAAPALGDILQRPVPLRDGIGRASDQVSTSSQQAQAMYNQGIAYLHSYVWIEAARSFNEALRLDSKLAMAYVGLSEAFGELGLPEGAREASGRAQALASGVTDRELFRIELRASQLDAVSHPRDASAQAAYRKKLDEILVKYPDNVELLLLGQAQDPLAGGHGMGAGRSSLGFYQRALGRSPDYFATHHLLTHAYENINRIDLAVGHAERYARAADGVPHSQR